MRCAIHKGKPSLLAKILGMYEVKMKNEQKTSSYCMVMENLFFGLKMTQDHLIYDL